MVREPSSFKEAMQYPEWVEAINQELDALSRNDTWMITDLPAGVKPIGCKWIFKVKLKSDGSVERCKARLVAKGYTQQQGVDYEEVFSPVANLVTVRLFFAVATAHSWPIHQLDVNNAFLHGHLKDTIYMKLPQGLNSPTGKVCKLQKSLYGLKQASREWNAEFSRFLCSLGFTASIHDPCLFTKGQGDTFLALLVYVDDAIITGPSLALLADLKSSLNDAFTIKDLGPAKFFLGMEIARGIDGTALNQRKYILDILSTHGLLCCKPTATPLPPGLNLSQDTDEFLQNPEQYRSLVGQLLYLNLTRPDLSHASQQLSQYMAKPAKVHWFAAVHVLKYLKGCPSLGVFYPVNTSFDLLAYSDADWATCLSSRKSLTGFCVFMGSSLISWKCKKQSTVSSSSAEAEYRALAVTTRELVWLHSLLSAFQVTSSTPITIFCDNDAALQITRNPVFHERTKHIEIDCHVVREKYVEGFVVPTAVSSADQIADFFTKPLYGPRFRSLLSKMAVFDLHHLHLEGGCKRMKMEMKMKMHEDAAVFVRGVGVNSCYVKSHFAFK